jgi:hypothetical protein
VPGILSRLAELGTEIVRNFKKLGFFGVIFGGCVGFWAKIKGEGVKLQRLGKIGKIQTVENVRKRLKTCENMRKMV